MDESELQVKVVILGNPAVGKSSILRRYIVGDCNFESQNTIGAKFMGKILKINEKTIKLNIWDTAGQERYMSFSKLYCRDAGAAVLVYDISEKESFEGMKKWYDGMSKDILPKETLLFIVGNKCDLVNGPCEFESDVLEYAEEICAEHFRVSAVSGLGIDELFDKIATKYAATVSYERRTSIILTNKFPLVANNKKKKRFC